MTNEGNVVTGLCVLTDDGLYTHCPRLIVVQGVNVVVYPNHAVIVTSVVKLTGTEGVVVFKGVADIVDDIGQHHFTILACPRILVSARLIRRADDDDQLLSHFHGPADNFSVSNSDWLKSPHKY